MVFRILVSLILIAFAAGTSRGAEVEFIVGDYLTTEGGSWSAEDSPLLRPFGVAFNQSDQMYIVELEGGRVFQRTPAGKLTQVSGDGSQSFRGDGGPFAKATYNGMHNCAITNDGDLLIADSWNHCIRRMDAENGIVSTFAGTGTAGFSGDGGLATEAAFDFIMCITLSPDGKTLHVADLRNRRIRAIDVRTRIVTTVAGNGERGVPENGAVAVDAPLVDPRAVAADAKGNIYVLERGGHALRRVLADGRIFTVAGTGQKGFQDGNSDQAAFASPKHICVDPAGRVVIADDQNAAVRLFDPEQQLVSTVLGRGFGDERIRLTNPHGVCWHDDWLYVIDTGNNRILRIRVP